MTKKPKTQVDELIDKLKDLDAQTAGRGWMISELVRIMEQSRSSLDLPDDTNEINPVRGCPDCGLLYQISPYFWGDADSLEFCPSCGFEIVNLGSLPDFYRTDDGFYIDSEDIRLGPYESLEDSQDHLWFWFAEKEKRRAQEEGGQESGQEDQEETKEESRQEEREHPHLRLVRTEEGQQVWRRHRRLDGQDGQGPEVEGQGPDTTGE